MNFFKTYIIIFLIITYVILQSFFKIFIEQGDAQKKVNLEKIVVETSELSLQKSYVYSNQAWGIFQKNTPSKKSDKIVVSQTSKMLSIDKTTFPIQICKGKNCIELIAIKNKTIVFMDNNHTFVSLKKDDKIFSDVSIKFFQNQTIDFYDHEHNTTYTIKMFEVNASKYKTNKIKEINK